MDVGDFNDNASHRLANMPEIRALTSDLGLVSAYHYYSGDTFGEERRPTHYYRSKEASPFHLNYCFLPVTWAEHITGVEVGSHSDWHELSDHMPLVVDVAL